MKSVKVKRSSIMGSVRCPPSKSYTHRGVAVASLAEGKSIIRNPLISRDTRATIDGCRILGSYVHLDADGYIEVHGRDRFTDGYRVINAENSGTTIRILTSISSLVQHGNTMLYGDASLNRRPMQPLIDALRQLGVICRSISHGTPPLLVNGDGLEGGRAYITGSVSSQFISALLIPAVHARESVEIHVTDEQVSYPYIDATIAVMERFSVKVEREGYSYYRVDNSQEYRSTEFYVPGDFSSAAMLLAAGALAGEVTVTGLDSTLPQADARIVDILESMSVDVKVHINSIKIGKSESIEGGVFNLGASPDLLPVLAVLALKAKGTVEIRGVRHARVKETDRVANIAREIAKLGAQVKEYEDGLSIKAPEKIRNAVLESYDDHRLFMALCIASLLADECIVNGADSVDVSYPTFIDDMRSLGASIE